MNSKNKKTILLVEDEPVTAKSGKNTLQKFGYSVIHAHSGEEAIELFNNNSAIDLILMDIDLGEGLDGTATAITILKKRSIPIVFLSSHIETEIVEKTEKITSYGYVVKNSGVTVLDASIKMAFRLFESNEKMKIAENTYRNMFINAQVGLFRTDLKTGLVVDANDCLAQFAGYKNRSELLEDGFNINKHYVRPEDRQKMIFLLKEHGQFINLEIEFKRKDGSLMWARYSGRIVADKGWVEGVSEDITARKLVEDGIKIKTVELEAANEKLEAAIEELNATNEELEAINEELISTNNGLITATKELRRSEKLLREKEQQLRIITDNIPAMISYTGAEDLVYRSVNQTLVDNFGMPAEQIIGRQIKEIIGEEEFNRVLPYIERVRNGERVEYESIASIHGEARWYHINYIPEINNDGEVTNIIALAFDSTDRKRAEVELFVKENRFRSVVEKSLVGIAIVNDSAQYIYVNEEFCRIAGYAENEILGRNFTFLLTEESMQLVYERNVLLQHGEEAPSHYEFSFLQKNGAKRIGELRNAVYPDLSGKMNSLIQVIDITERKEVEDTLKNAEELYRNIFMNAQAGLFMTDIKTGRILDANDCMVRFLGLKDRAELLSKPFNIADRYVDINDRQRLISLLKKHGRLSNFEARFRRNNGSIIWLRFAARIVESKGWIEIVSDDITERKQADEKIKILLSEKELILREVHHRIKNNMNTINSILTLHADTMKDPLAISALEEAGGRVHSMMVLYDKLYQSPDFKEISVRNYIPSLVDEIIDNFPGSGFIRVEKKIDDFILDVKRLQPLGIIINELFTNIVKHAMRDRNDLLITMSVLLVDGYVVIEINDDGIGIPESVDFETTAGFGLQLVKMLTEQIDGNIRIEREKGTGFILKFLF